MFKADLIERTAPFRSAEDDPSRKLASCPALVLNADYTPLSYYPLSLWPWQTAIKAVFLERVDIVASYEREVHSPSLDMKIPSVIALRQYVRPSEFPAFTRFNLFLRDRFQCQYCGAEKDLTFDHVIPRRLGGRTSCMWAWCGVRPPFFMLHGAQAVAMFSQVVRPPSRRGIT